MHATLHTLRSPQPDLGSAHVLPFHKVLDLIYIALRDESQFEVWVGAICLVWLNQTLNYPVLPHGQ
jgi:hypothetical protein